MKTFFILSLFVVALAYADKDSGSSEENVREVAKLLEEKFNITILHDIVTLGEKAKAKCPDLEDKIEKVGEKVQECMEDIDLGSETFCSLIRKNFARCTKPARELVSSCLPDESKDLPELGEKIILAIIDQACNSTVEEILELLNPCAIEKDFASFPVCVDIKNVFVQHKDKLPSKSLICSTFPKMRACAKAHIDASCQNPITKKAALNFHDAIENSIKDKCDALNEP